MPKGRGPGKQGSVQSKSGKPARKGEARSGATATGRGPKPKAKKAATRTRTPRTATPGPSPARRAAKPPRSGPRANAPKRRPPPATDTLPQGTEPPRELQKPSNGRAGSTRTPAPSSAITRDRASSRPETVARATQLDWNDTLRNARSPDDLVDRWARRGDELLRRLTEHGAAQHEYRADLRDGRFVWIAPEGRVSAEARAQVVCSWSRSTSVVAMAWSDALVRRSAIARIDGMASERDDVDEEGAWRVAMEAAEAAGAQYLYRVPTPHAWYFLALRDLTFAPDRESFNPGTPVGLVLRGLADTRQAIESRAEPAAVVRERMVGIGSALLHHAEYAYRDTDWVARLERTGRRMAHLAGMVPRASYGTIAAGRPSDDWIDRDLAVELIHAIALLEDEWNAFA